MATALSTLILCAGFHLIIHMSLCTYWLPIHLTIEQNPINYLYNSLALWLTLNLPLITMLMFPWLLMAKLCSPASMFGGSLIPVIINWLSSVSTPINVCLLRTATAESLCDPGTSLSSAFSIALIKGWYFRDFLPSAGPLHISYASAHSPRADCRSGAASGPLRTQLEAAALSMQPQVVPPWTLRTWPTPA